MFLSTFILNQIDRILRNEATEDHLDNLFITQIQHAIEYESEKEGTSKSEITNILIDVVSQCNNGLNLAAVRIATKLLSDYVSVR